MNLSTSYLLFSKRMSEDEEIQRYRQKLAEQRAVIPIWEKKCLTIEEAAEYSGIGINLLYKMVKEKKCPFAVVSGNQYLIAREKLERYLCKQTEIK